MFSVFSERLFEENKTLMMHIAFLQSVSCIWAIKVKTQTPVYWKDAPLTRKCSISVIFV